MRSYYFKHRASFDFSSDTYDIGRPFLWHKDLEDNHFLYRLSQLEERQHAAFYQYHKNHFLDNDPVQDEKEFLKHVWELVTDRIEELRVKETFRAGHVIRLRQKKMLRTFLEYLQTIDQWQTGQS